MRRLELHITYTCPERCAFCSEDHRMRDFSAFPVTYGRVARVLAEQVARGVESVHFTGGEPTIHPRFLDILKLAKALGLRTSIGTIGTRLADARFAEAVMPYLDEALFSVHGPDAATHDEAAGRVGSFDRVTRAIANARAKPGFRPFVNTVLTRANLARLPDTAALARDVDAALLIVSNVTPEGLGADRYDTLTVRLPEVAAVAPRVVAAAAPAIVRFFGLPMCALAGARMVSNDLFWNPRVTVEWARRPGAVALDGIYSWAPDRGRRHAPACAECAYQGVCAGVFGTYLDRFGDAEVTPLEAA
jgi:MoaA/NifB/PqqE/SkfB family radical SAM enzyme